MFRLEARHFLGPTRRLAGGSCDPRVTTQRLAACEIGAGGGCLARAGPTREDRNAGFQSKPHRLTLRGRQHVTLLGCTDAYAACNDRLDDGAFIACERTRHRGETRDGPRHAPLRFEHVGPVGAPPISHESADVVGLVDRRVKRCLGDTRSDERVGLSIAAPRV